MTIYAAYCRTCGELHHWTIDSTLKDHQYSERKRVIMRRVDNEGECKEKAQFSFLDTAKPV